MPFSPIKIRYLRHQLDLTQREFAAVLSEFAAVSSKLKSKVTQSAVARWEQGENMPSADKIGFMIDLARRRNIEVDFFPYSRDRSSAKVRLLKSN